ncbi:hypothetical protein BSY18_1718 [Blastomonas sp. RAC04]|uniref:hypothetical protein n=1 Tax=Blastomonas TaxID=150203 RepID=UPI00083E0930|nr:MULTISPECIES: hypothetical protein [unclassified Blastomonas]AOG01366.1 hypothetical protein BSY18_1718 [Blastomonas sp. RAC04]
MKKLALFIAMIVGVLTPVQAVQSQSGQAQGQGNGAGQCSGPYVLTARQSSGQTYDPNENTSAIVRINLQPAASDTPQGCASLPVSIFPQSASTFTFANGGNAIGFTQVNSGLVSQANATRFELSGNARSQLVRGTPVDVDLFEISAGQFLAAGEYQGTVLVQVGDGLPTPVLFTIIVRPAIKFVIENGSLQKDLSFGDVTDGSTLQTTVFYQSNAAVAITIQSQNLGSLVHEGGSAFGNIPYSLVYDGTPVNLASLAQINRAFTGLGTRREQMQLRVEPQTRKYAGTYRDVLTLNYTAF